MLVLKSVLTSCKMKCSEFWFNVNWRRFSCLCIYWHVSVTTSYHGDLIMSASDDETNIFLMDRNSQLDIAFLISLHPWRLVGLTSLSSQGLVPRQTLSVTDTPLHEFDKHVLTTKQKKVTVGYNSICYIMPLTLSRVLFNSSGTHRPTTNRDAFFYKGEKLKIHSRFCLKC